MSQTCYGGGVTGRLCMGSAKGNEIHDDEQPSTDGLLGRREANRSHVRITKIGEVSRWRLLRDKIWWFFHYGW